MRKPTRSQTAQFYTALREQVRQLSGGEEVVAAFEQDPDAGAAQLEDFLRKSLQEDPALADRLAAALAPSGQPHFVTQVSGGHVDQIVNIARLGVLNLTLKRQFFLFRDVKQLLVVLSLAVVSAALVWGVQWWWSQPRVMDGDYNIAVAEFGEVGAEGIERTKLGATISTALFNYLESEFAGSQFGLDVQVEHKNTPTITEEEEARALAQKMNAHLVIYGTVAGDAERAEFDPNFWVREEADTEEVTGQSRLGKLIGFDARELQYPDQINDLLRRRARVLLSLAKGLVYLKGEEASHAQREFVRARAEMVNTGACEPGEENGDTAGCELVYLLIGVTQSMQKEYAAAEENYNQAIALNPDYARAYLGLGNLYYKLGTEQDFRADYLQQALAFYDEAAARAPEAAPCAMIEQKVAVVCGNVFVVEAQKANDPALYRKAEELYQQVIDEFKALDKDSEEWPRYKEVAANAYFGRGVAYERQGFIDEAVDAYQLCAQLTTSTSLRALARERIADIEAAVG